MVWQRLIAPRARYCPVGCPSERSVRQTVADFTSQPQYPQTTSYVYPQRAAASGGVERMRREAQLAALRYDEERQKNRSLQRDTKVPPFPLVMHTGHT